MSKQPDHVMRGLRWGAILAASLAIAVASYRIAREAPPPEPEAPSKAPSIPIAAAAPAPPANPMQPVPAPPPLRKVARTVPPPVRSQSASIAEVVATEQPAPVEVPAQAVSQPSVESKPLAPAVSAAASDPPEPARDSRGKRFLKAVGRVFRLGGKS